MTKHKKGKILKKEVEVIFTLTKISTLKSNLNLPKEVPSIDSKEFTYSLGANTNVNPPQKSIQILIIYRFKLRGDIIFELEVANDYEIDNFDLVVSDGKVLDNGFLEFLINLSADHARGIQSTIIMGTPIEHYYMPLIDHKKRREREKKKMLAS